MSGKESTIWRNAGVITAIVTLVTALVTHIANPLITTYVDLSPFRDRDKAGATVERMTYFYNIADSYQHGKDMIARAGEERHNMVLNFRSSLPNDQQESLYADIASLVARGPTRYTRVITVDSDPDFENTKWFLLQLGMNDRFRLMVSLPTHGFPSCIITEKEAILGFNDDEGVIEHAVHVAGPESLVEDWRNLYNSVALDRTRVVVVKDFEDDVGADTVDARIERAKEALEGLEALD